MTALAAKRSTPRMGAQGTTVNLGCAASTTYYQGGMISRDSSGYAIKTTATSAAPIGVYHGPTFTSSGTAAAESIDVEGGIYRFENSGSTDIIAIDDIGSVFYVVDDQTFAASVSSPARTVGGVIVNVDSAGVWGQVDILGRKA
jgi:uncharacterized protein YaiE (UPF0345 family)